MRQGSTFFGGGSEEDLFLAPGQVPFSGSSVATVPFGTVAPSSTAAPPQAPFPGPARSTPTSMPTSARPREERPTIDADARAPYFQTLAPESPDFAATMSPQNLGGGYGPDGLPRHAESPVPGVAPPRLPGATVHGPDGMPRLPSDVLPDGVPADTNALEEAPEEEVPLLSMMKSDARRCQPCAQVDRRDFLVLWLVPPLAFLATVWPFAFWGRSHPLTCLCFSGCACAASAYAIGACRSPAAVANGKRGNSGVGAAFPLVSRSAAVLLPAGACVLGAMVGLFLQQEYMLFVQFYRNSQTYTNVVPSDASASVADAGKLTFAVDSFVDVAQSVGYVREEGGSLYCAAPVRDVGSAAAGDRVQFWAVGVGCCNTEGGFSCDAAGDADARSGIVLFDVGDRLEYFDRARMKVEAAFSLQSVEKPVFVRWVHISDLDMVANSYRAWTIALLLVSTLLCVGLSLLPANIFHISHDVLDDKVGV